MSLGKIIIGGEKQVGVQQTHPELLCQHRKTAEVIEQPDQLQLVAGIRSEPEFDLVVRLAKLGQR